MAETVWELDDSVPADLAQQPQPVPAETGQALNDSAPLPLLETFTAPPASWTLAYWGGPATMDFPVSGAASITGTGAVAFQTAALAGAALEAFTATGAETFAHPAVASSGVEKFSGSGSEILGHPLLDGTGSNVLAITSTGAVAFQVPSLLGGQAPVVILEGGQFPLLRPIPQHRRPVVSRRTRPPVLTTEPEPPPLPRRSNDEDALVALYAAGVLNEDEFAALIAAA